ncbi:ABC transporter transmembrane domain-containing protein [Streptomyces sp. NPDC050504]|uniref:ABC transporter transmembrane domain-containing protein n=1 Tax=Streptomyces sp. NPDC050504 TaxID=3365618 RepID=UPI003792AB68
MGEPHAGLGAGRGPAGDEPGTPDLRGPLRYLWWLVTSQPGRAWAGAVLASVWMCLLTLQPYLISRAVDDGLAAGDRGALLRWTAAFLVSGVFVALVGVLRHRTMTRLRMDASFRTARIVVRQAVRLGAALPRRVGAGEVVTIGISDVRAMSQALTVIGPGVGSVLAYVLVAALLLRISPVLAAVVLLGVPLLVVVLGPLLRRLQSTEAVYRERQGELASLLGDIVGGLRVLGGLGGKEAFAKRYRGESERLRSEGYRVGAVASWIQALSLGLPTLFLAGVTWPAARMAAEGTITVGELTAVYGYVAALWIPVYFLVEGGYDISRGLVMARRIVRFLALEPRSGADGTPAPAPAGPAPLRDPDSGLDVLPGRLTALVSAAPGDAVAVVDRIGGFVRSAATWGALRLDGVSLTEVRDRILVADNEADLFAGPLREVLSGRGAPDEEAIARAVRAAVAQDVVRGLREGLDAPVGSGGRNLSGGQRQRLRLARALLADPEVLLAVEPTSAVDAHTEAAMAQRLREARAGRTTLIVSTSPLVLDRADAVHFLVDGRVAASGSHRELLAREPGYRRLVARDDEEGPWDAGTVGDSEAVR